MEDEKAISAAATKRSSEHQVLCVSGRRRKAEPTHDTALSWLVAICGFLCNVIILGCSYSYGVLLPSLLEEFHAGKATTAWIGTVATSLSFFFGPVVGKMSSRFSARIVAVSGAFFASAGLLAASQSPNIPVLFLTYGLLFGASSCFVYTSVFLIVPTYFLKWRSLAVGMIVCGPGAGMFVMGPILGAIVEVYNWRGALIAEAGMVFLIVFLAGCSFQPNTSDRETKKSTCGNQVESDDSCHSETDIPLWKNRQFIVYNSCTALLNVGDLIPIVHLASYCKEIGINLKMPSRLYLTIGLCSMLSRVATGQLFDVKRLNRQSVLQGASVVLGVSTLLCPLAKTFTGLTLYSVVLGLANGSFATAINLLILDSVPAHQRPQAYGIWLFSLSVTMLIGAPLGGFMADTLGSYVPAFFFAGSVYLVCASLICILWCWKGPELLLVHAELVPSFPDELIIYEMLTVL